MELLTSVKKETKQITFILLFLSLLQLLPYFVLKQNVSVPVNDTMDVYIPQYELTATKEFFLCKTDKLFPQEINGVNRDLLVSDLSVISFLFLIAAPFWAFTLNLLLIKLIAFIGMYLFLKNNFNTLTQQQHAIGAFLFSCIPFFPFFGIGIAGQPLLINTLINIHKKRSDYLDVVIVILFPFYSTLIFTNIFVIGSSALFCCYWIIKNRELPLRLILATLVLLVLGILVDFRLFHATMDPAFIPHRIEFDLKYLIDRSQLVGMIYYTFRILFTGIFHVETFYSVFVGMIFLLYLYQLKKFSGKKAIFYLVIYILLIALLYGFSFTSYFYVLANKVTILKKFTISRFYTQLPFLYFLLTALCIQQILEQNNQVQRKALRMVIGLAMFVLFFNTYPLKALVHLNSPALNVIPTYSEYYDTEILDQVKASIPAAMEDYRVVGVGIDPGVLQYNGFYTLDGYMNIYPLEYKKRFRPVIAKELAKSTVAKNYFDNWGSRCYIFSSEIGIDLNKTSPDTTSITKLEIDTKALQALCNTNVYLISTRTINNSKELGLQLMKTFRSSNKFRRKLVLYKVSDEYL